MSKNKEIWEQRHIDSLGRLHRPTAFCKFVYYNFLKDKKGKLLDLGCGKGADSIFFHNKGFEVTGIDYASEAIKQFNETQKRYDIFLKALIQDYTKPLPFEPRSFDVVYSRLGINYFDDKTTKKIISEISRLLKSEGLLLFQVKSINDKSYGQGKEVEKDMFEEENGYARHFFSKKYAEKLLEDYHILMLEERVIPEKSTYLEVIAEKK